MIKAFSYIKPKLSDKIEFNQLSDNEYIVANSYDKHYIKVNKNTRNMMFLMDGNKTIEEICVLFNQKYNQNITKKEIEFLISEKLLNFGVIDGFRDKIKKYEKPSYLKLSFIIISEKRLSKIAPIFHFLFNYYIVLILSAISIITILTLLITNFDLYTTFDIHNSIVYFILIMSISLIFHEIGHASATSFFGAKHGGIGFGFYLLSPVYFADVTDVWRLSKKQRIAVNLSGVYFELIFCSLVAIFSYLVENFTLVIVTIAVFIHTLFNLNPFMRSDGYWILTDLLQKPNLSFHSFKKVKIFFQTIVKWKKIKWKKIDYLLFAYGSVNMMFIIGFLYYILVLNPNIVLFFPENLNIFLSNLLVSDAQISFEKYFELIIPVFFFILLFNWAKKYFTPLARVCNACLTLLARLRF